MTKKRSFCILLTIIAWGLMYYYYLPPMNIHSQEMWSFFVGLIVVGLVINFASIVNAIFIQKDTEERNRVFQKTKKYLVFPAFAILLYVGGILLSSPILRASSYRELLVVETGDFSTNIHEVDYNQIPILDADSAARLAEREMGSLVDMVSQFEVSRYYSQINFEGKPVRVTPLQYGDAIKWLMNRNEGIPGYMKIDMTTQDAELVKLTDGDQIKYSPFEYFGRNLYRHIRFNYPTAMIRTMDFEVDEDGRPYWVCSVETKTIGLFGGTDIIGIVLVDAITGEHTYHDITDVPTWIDQVYDANLLIEQYNYYGMLKNGFINSVIGQREVLQSTEGYNYIALDDDVWVYTGVTSVGSDQSNVGFVLMNARTKETNYYQISGAKEISAMSSAEGQVQNLQYVATFPILLNIADEPTYFLSLKDGAGLVKKYAMVNIQRYQIVAIGDTVQECETAYRQLMTGNGISLTNEEDLAIAEGLIESIQNIVIDGNTLYYIGLENEKGLFGVPVKDNLEILLYGIEDEIAFEYVENENGIHTVLGIQ
ncbi:MAG: CvpA family protein [Bacillota bacterium]